ncbi:MAG: site-2 protease family protein [Eubacteriales bacterium]|nr:site-2 protease family protein [Eubacteriales bacterium]MDD3883042.1 site-2 protease family protein [Eubacteriales bacterium]MDD4513631.1 site-2 protease family protein [Eubacteriales bacterium]
MFYWLDMLTQHPIEFLSLMLFRAPAVLLALMLHECAHGYVAYKCGDPTAKMLGRLSLNPLKHLDPIGTILMFLVGFGWAKPVPVNPRNFGNYKRDTIMVSLAGIIVNLTLFLLSTAIMVSLNSLLWKPQYAAYYSNLQLLGFGSSSNVLTWPVLDGSMNEFFKTPWLQYIYYFLMQFSIVNIGLGVFNLIPVPPLDGYRVVGSLFTKNGKSFLPQNYERIGMGIMMLICLTTNVVGNVMSAVTTAVQSGVIQLFTMIAGG